MSRRGHKTKNDHPAAPVLRSNPARTRVLFLSYIACGVILGLAILGVRHNWFFAAPQKYAEEDAGPIALNNTKPADPAPDGMVWIPGGTFWMGDNNFTDAVPV